MFSIPLAFNFVCFVLLAWRFHHFASGSDSPLVVAINFIEQRPHITLPKHIRDIPLGFAFRVLANLIFDLILYSRVWPLVSDFATGHLYYRLCNGFRFREEEIVFRAPIGTLRNITVDVPNLPEDERAKRWMGSIVEATDEKMLENNSGPNTRSSFWMVDFNAMADAQSAYRKGEIALNTWETSVWSKDGENWDSWDVNKAKTQQIDFGKVIEKLGVCTVLFFVIDTVTEHVCSSSLS